MNWRQQQDPATTIPVEPPRLGRKLTRRTVVGAGAAGAVGIAAVGPFAPASADAVPTGSFRAPALRGQAADEGVRGGRLRVATTGQGVGPGLYDCLAILGRETCRARIEQIQAELDTEMNRSRLPEPAIF